MNRVDYVGPLNALSKLNHTRMLRISRTDVDKSQDLSIFSEKGAMRYVPVASSTSPSANDSKQAPQGLGDGASRRSILTVRLVICAVRAAIGSSASSGRRVEIA
jgi:hypothetical protein